MCWRSMFWAARALRRSMPISLYGEVASASPYRNLTREDFDKVVDFVATGGYALKRYDQYARLRKTPEGKWRVSHPRVAQQYRLNVGVIVEEPMIEIRLQSKGRPTGAGGRSLGQLEEYFVEQLTPGDTFVFSGQRAALRGHTRRCGIRHAHAGFAS
ncbi:MAG: hypothetical protein WDM89_01055 [Rhizomicrobium sp.]